MWLGQVCARKLWSSIASLGSVWRFLLRVHLLFDVVAVSANLCLNRRLLEVGGLWLLGGGRQFRLLGGLLLVLGPLVNFCACGLRLRFHLCGR